MKSQMSAFQREVIAAGKAPNFIDAILAVSGFLDVVTGALFGWQGHQLSD